MNKAFPYTSVHHYLDMLLKSRSNVSAAEIMELKKEYWKLWYRYYRREQRQRKKEYTLRLDMPCLLEIDRRRGRLSRSKFMYFLIANGLNGDNQLMINDADIGIIQQHLVQVMNLLDEMRDEDGVEIEAEILERLTALECEINELVKNIQR